MKRTLVLSILMLLAVSASAFAQTEFVPSWKIGDRWVLESSYRDMNAENETWLKPVQWVFKVRAIKEKDGVECYVLHAFARHGEMKEQAVLWLSTADLRPMRVIDIFPGADRMQFAEREIDQSNPEPLLAKDTLVPYDMPVFPLTKEAEVSRTADGSRAQGVKEFFSAIKQKFTSVKKVGGFSFKRSLNQTTKSPEKKYVDEVKKYDSKSGAKTSRAKSASGISPMFQIQLDEERSGTNLTQVWRDDLPWAATSQTDSRKVRLVPESELSQGGNK